MDDVTHSLLNLEKHTCENIQLNNQIHLGRGYKQRFQINNRIGYLELFPSNAGRNNQLMRSIPLTIDSHPSRITLTDLFLRNRLKHFLPKEKLTDLPLELYSAVMEAALDYELNLFEKMLEAPIEIAGTNQQQRTATDNITVLFYLRWEEYDHPIEGYLSFKQPLLPLFLKAFEKIPKREQHDWELLSKKIHFEIGSTQLSAAMLQDIVIGDVIFLDHCPFVKENTVFIPITSDLLLTAQVKENLIIINGKCKEIEMDEKKPELIDMDNLPIDLVFDVGEQKISLRELKTLQPGYTFTLDTSLEKPVTIRANGHRIGTGELLEINNRIGVRVLELSGKFDG
jgi:type III secretion system YscQ/HrcQ family protein